MSYSLYKTCINFDKRQLKTNQTKNSQITKKLKKLSPLELGFKKILKTTVLNLNLGFSSSFNTQHIKGY